MIASEGLLFRRLTPEYPLPRRLSPGGPLPLRLTLGGPLPRRPMPEGQLPRRLSLEGSTNAISNRETVVPRPAQVEGFAPVTNPGEKATGY